MTGNTAFFSRERSTVYLGSTTRAQQNDAGDHCALEE
jgi:hypothetical protein